MKKTHLPYLINIVLAIAFLMLLPLLPTATIAGFQQQGNVATTAIIIVFVVVFTALVFILNALLKSNKNYIALLINLLVSIVCITLLHLSSYLTWWLPLATCAGLAVLLQSNEWLLYKAKHSLTTRKISHLLLNEFLADYTTRVDALCVDTNATDNKLLYSNGKTIVLITAATNALGELHTHLTALRLMSIAKTRNVSYGINLSLVVQFVVFWAASYAYNFNYLLITEMINILLTYVVLSNAVQLLLLAINQKFELVYDILLFDNTIASTSFEAFITNSYPTDNVAKRLHIIRNLEESQLAPYAMAQHVSNYNIGLIGV